MTAQDDPAVGLDLDNFWLVQEEIKHDPLNPHWEVPTPLDMVVRLTRPQREQRVRRLIEMAWVRFYQAIDECMPDKEIRHIAAMFSGGNDSSTVASIFRPVLTHMIHANTGTGIEGTRIHVRKVAADWGTPLVEETPDPGEGYEDMVLGSIRTKGTGEVIWPGGFPGPATHSLMQQRLKERCTDKARHTLGIANSRKFRGIWIAGRRRTESDARSTVPHFEADGSVVWVSPIAIWHKADLLMYRLMLAAGECTDPACPYLAGPPAPGTPLPAVPRPLTVAGRPSHMPGCPNHPVPLNPVAEILGMSGECGCLANARPGEAARWRAAFPNDPWIKKVNTWEEILKDRDDIPEHRKKWGWGGDVLDRKKLEAAFRAETATKAGRMCGKDCGIDPLVRMMDPYDTAGSLF